MQRGILSGRIRRTAIPVCLGLTMLMISPLCGQQTSPLSFDPATVFDEVTDLVAEHFFDPEFDVESWNARAGSFRERALDAASHDDFSRVMAELLATLETSHTAYFSRLNPRRYQLLSVFHQVFEGQPDDLFVYEGIGIDTRSRADGVFVSAVFDGLPADQAGLQFGDRLVSVDGQPFHPINSFRGKSGQTVAVTVERQGRQTAIPVVPRALDGRTMFRTAMQDSVRVIERGDQRIGYVHVWSYAGTDYQESLRSLVLWGDLASCDSLALDLRDGWGGADLNYVNLFRPPIVEIETASRGAPEQTYTGVWGKPVALITNRGSTSGKELYTYAFRKLGLGPVVGETTAGAVVAGRCFLLSNGDALYLAVTDIRVDGHRIEGQGISPDQVVPRPLETADGSDPQLEAALQVLSAEPSAGR